MVDTGGYVYTGLPQTCQVNLIGPGISMIFCNHFFQLDFIDTAVVGDSAGRPHCRTRMTSIFIFRKQQSLHHPLLKTEMTVVYWSPP